MKLKDFVDNWWRHNSPPGTRELFDTEEWRRRCLILFAVILGLIVLAWLARALGLAV
ncbi:MAG: hypothetical protein AB7P20_20305 [Rhizobiaceae bacterium]